MIVDYDREWPRLFEEERARVLRLIREFVVAVEHVGSTSVPGLAAKPIVDVLVGLRSLSDSPAIVEQMVGAGYRYVPDYEVDLPERRYFSRGPEGARTHHLHMVETTTEFWRRHIAFRDWLRANPETALEYEDLKRRLAELHNSEQIADYTDAKTDFIQDIERRALIGLDR